MSSTTPEGMTVSEILIRCYHAGSVSQGGKTIHNGTVQEYEEAINAIRRADMEAVIGEDEPDIPTGDRNEKGWHTFKVNPNNSLRAKQRTIMQERLK